jgi:hypothetical protein
LLALLHGREAAGSTDGSSYAVVTMDGDATAMQTPPRGGACVVIVGG